MLAKTYHAVIPRQSAAGLCRRPYLAPPGPSSHPHSWKMDHLLPPVKEVSQGLQWDMGVLGDSSG